MQLSKQTIGAQVQQNHITHFINDIVFVRSQQHRNAAPQYTDYIGHTHLKQITVISPHAVH